MTRGRQPDTRIGEYAEKYGVSYRKVKQVGIDLLSEMSEHARATILTLPRPAKRKRILLGQNPALQRKYKPPCPLANVLALAEKMERRIRGTVHDLVILGTKAERKPIDSEKVDRMMELATGRRA